MTASFGRRNRAPARDPATPAPSAELALTQEQRAYLFAGEEWETASGVATAPLPVRPTRRAALIASAAMTATTVALGAIGQHDAALAGLPPAMEPMTQEFLTLIGAAAAPLALAWSLVVNFLNFSANLWLTRALAGAFGLSSLPAYAGIGALLGVGMAWLSAVLGLGASEIGLGMEALAGAGVAALYRQLSGPARL